MFAAALPGPPKMARGSQTGEPHLPVRGYTYLGLLFVLALGGVFIAHQGEVATTTGQREREAELVFRGDEIRRAIESYARTTPSGTKRWPQSLADLVVDQRQPLARYHLRRSYEDPFTRQPDWELLPAPEEPGGFAGVRSRARVKPMRLAPSLPMSAEQAILAAQCVCAWDFVARP